MSFLEHVWLDAGLPAPRVVHVHAAGPPWLAARVASELADLFPYALVVTAAPAAPADLVVLAHLKAAQPDRGQVRWLLAQPATAVMCYAVPTRDVVVVPRERVLRWALRRRATFAVRRLVRRHPRAWRFLEGRCASSW